jgi:hypothetical protein
MTSEAQRDLPSQPQDTCPMIDHVIGVLDGICRYMRRYEWIDNVGDLHSMLSDINSDICLDDDMEKIRTNVCLIRDWGQSWKEYALQLEKEHNVKLEEENSLDIQN